MKKFVPYIDRMFRKYGEEYFGKEKMDTLTDEQVEEARCEAMKALTYVVSVCGAKDGNGQVKELFCDYCNICFFGWE